jgi:hypothetical protein
MINLPGRAVATKNVRSAAGVSLARMSRGRLHGSCADPYRSSAHRHPNRGKFLRLGQAGAPPNPISLPSGSRKVALRTPLA